MQNPLETACSLIEEARQKIEEMSPEEKFEIGNMAIDMISDYPLYGSRSNITYEEAILIVLVTEGEDFVNSLKEGE